MSLRVRVIAALFAGKLRLFPLESSSDPVLPLNLDSDAVLIRIKVLISVISISLALFSFELFPGRVAVVIMLGLGCVGR